MRRFRTVVCLSMSFWMVFGLTGCWATMVKGSSSDIQTNSSPRGAEVWVNGINRGMTPLKLTLRSNENYTIMFKKEGYETVTRNVSCSVSAGWVILDIMSGIVPVIIDAATGSWYRLDQENLDVVLSKQQKSSRVPSKNKAVASRPKRSEE